MSGIYFCQPGELVLCWGGAQRVDSDGLIGRVKGIRKGMVEIELPLCQPTAKPKCILLNPTDFIDASELDEDDENSTDADGDDNNGSDEMDLTDGDMDALIEQVITDLHRQSSIPRALSGPPSAEETVWNSDNDRWKETIAQAQQLQRSNDSIAALQTWRASVALASSTHERLVSILMCADSAFAMSDIESGLGYFQEYFQLNPNDVRSQLRCCDLLFAHVADSRVMQLLSDRLARLSASFPNSVSVWSRVAALLWHRQQSANDPCAWSSLTSALRRCVYYCPLESEVEVAPSMAMDAYLSAAATVMNIASSSHSQPSNELPDSTQLLQWAVRALVRALNVARAHGVDPLSTPQRSASTRQQHTKLTTARQAAPALSRLWAQLADCLRLLAASDQALASAQSFAEQWRGIATQ